MHFLSMLTIDRWIALASSLGTFLASIFALFNIRELRMQRAQQFQPRLMPTESVYSVSINPKGRFGLEGGADKALLLINVGHGVAADISLTWEFPLEKWIEKVNILSAQRGAGVGFDRTTFGLGIRVNGKELGGVRSPDDRATLPYIVPVSANPEPQRVPIPSAALVLMYTYYYSYFKGMGIVEGVYVNPDAEFFLDFSLSYKDTIGREYRHSGTVAFSVLMTNAEEDLISNDINISFAVRTIRTEPVEGYSIVSKIALDVVKNSFRKAAGNFM